MVSIMYKTLIIPILLLWSSASFAINSVSIVTTGTGQSEDAALMQAFKNAVSKVYGTYIYSYTESSNNELISDEIIGIEKGFVKSYKIRDKRVKKGVHSVVVDVVVKKDPVIKLIRKNKKTLIGDLIKDAKKIKYKQKRLKKIAKLLKTISGNPDRILRDGYDINLIGYQIDDVGIDYVDASYLIEIKLNTEFWNQYMEIIKYASEVTYSGNENYITEGMFYIGDNYNRGISDSLNGFCTNFKTMGSHRFKLFISENPKKNSNYRVHKSLSKYLVKNFRVNIKVADKNKKLSLFKNAFFNNKVAYLYQNKIAENSFGNPVLSKKCIDFSTKHNVVTSINHNKQHDYGRFSYEGKMNQLPILFRKLNPNKNNHFLMFYNGDFYGSLINNKILIPLSFRLKDESQLENLSFDMKINRTN